MNKGERIELVRAMECVVRSVNNEEIIDSWLTCGVADGDIDEHTKDYQLEDYVTDDKDFAALMVLFLEIMKQARKDGGLYCDKVVSE